MGDSAIRDGELIARFLTTRSEEAFTLLVERHTRLVYGVCLRVLGDADRAQDATQATFLVLLRKLGELKHDAALSGWLFRVAEQTARNMRKSQIRLERREREAGMLAQRGAEEVAWERVRPELDGALASLPAVQRDAILLRYMKGLTRVEIARELNCPELTVQTRLSRALAALRSRLAGRGVQVSAALLMGSLASQAAPLAPPALPATVAAACLGKAAVSAGVSAAVQQTVRSMLVAKAKLWAAVVMVAGLSCGTVKLLLHAPAPIPHVFYVDAQQSNASDSNIGSSAGAPWKTISRAVRKLKPGDTVWIKAGEYREAVSFTANGTAAQPITIQAWPGDEGKVLIKGSDLITEWRPEKGEQWSTPWNHALDTAYPERWPQRGSEYPYDFDYLQRGEMVFADGEPLQQVTARTRLARGNFYVDENAHRLAVMLPDGSAPAAHRLELSVRQEGIHAYTCHYLTLAGLTVTHVSNRYQSGAFSVSGDHNGVTGNTAVLNNLDGFVISGSALKISANHALRNGAIGMAVSASTALIENNITDNNGWRFGPGWIAAGLRVDVSRDITVRGHVATGNNGSGIVLHTVGANSRVEACRMDNNVGCGLGIISCETGISAAYNVISRTRSWPAFKRAYATGVGVELASTIAPVLDHNTIAANERYGIMLEGKLSSNAPHPDTWPADSHITNNIIADNGAGGVLFWLWDGYQDAAHLRTHSFDFNLWHQPKNPIAAYPDKDPFALKNYTLRTTLADWKAAFGQDQHSLEADPQFVNPKALDFRLKSGSPALNKASEFGSSSAADIGAWQHTTERTGP